MAQGRPHPVSACGGAPALRAGKLLWDWVYLGVPTQTYVAGS